MPPQQQILSDHAHIRPARGVPSPPGQILMDLVHRVGQCHRELRRILNASIDDTEVNDTAFLVLWFCAAADDPGVPQADLTAAASVSAAQMSGVLERLRCHGWLKSVRLEGDRRRQWWRLTAEGWQVYERISAAIAPLGEQLVGKLSATEQVQLRRLLERLTLNVESSSRLKAFAPDGQALPRRKSQGGGK